MLGSATMMGMKRAGVLVAMLPIAVAACASGRGGPDAAEGGASLGDAADESVVACQGLEDCRLHFTGGLGVFCCIDKRCVFGQSAEALPCADANAQLIKASNYDQSCQTDSDCVAVAEGNFCRPGAADCPSASISKSASAQYWADVGKTHAAVCEAPISGCLGGAGAPCCRHGACSIDCVAPSDGLAGCASAGGWCVYGSTGLNPCGSLDEVGPPDSCAYSDQTCCVRVVGIDVDAGADAGDAIAE
jgi:hypothetical protein